MTKQVERTARTRESIVNAFLELANEKGMDRVTISEVMKKVGMNRGTFYMYFDDIGDLIGQLEQDIISNFRSQAPAIKDDLTNMNFDESAQRVANLFSDYDDRFFLLVDNDPHFISEIRKDADKLLSESFPWMSESPYKRYIVAGYSSAIIGALSSWHYGGRKVPIVDLIRQLQKLWYGGLKDYLKPPNPQVK